MRHLVPGKLIVLSILILSGCSSPQSVTSNPADRLHYDGVLHISAAQADKIIIDSIHQGWSDKSPRKIDANTIGYDFKVWSGSNHDTVFAQAISRGHNAYIFSVSNAGNAPQAGAPARDKLLKLLADNARKLILASSPAKSQMSQ